MSRIRKSLIVFLAGLLVVEPFLPLWAQTPTSPPRNNANAVTPGLVIIVEGIGGLDMVGKSADVALRQAGLPHEVYHFAWTHGTGKLFKDLQDTQHILKKAEELAEFIKDYRAKHPDRPIYIVGKSAGTAVVLYALRGLPANTVDRVVLLSAAVSPTFDLRGSLVATRREIISYHSRNDRMILGWGTSHFGTADRYYGKGAGLTGFVVPTQLEEQERELYARLLQVPWSSRMLRGGNTGGHSGTSMPWFLTSEVVPWLR